MTKQRGFAHLVLIIVIAAVIAGGIYIYREKIKLALSLGKAASSPLAVITNSVGPFNCSDTTANRNCTISFPWGNNEYQLNKVTYTFYYEGNRFADPWSLVGDRIATLDMCISDTPNKMSGKCLSPSFNYRGHGNFNKKRLDGILQVDGTDKTPYRYLNIKVYAQFAITSTYVTMEARSLRPVFNKYTVCQGKTCDLKSVEAGKIINVAWNVSGATKVKLTSSGSIGSKDLANADKLPAGNATFVPIAANKTATFKLEATGPTGLKTVKTINVNITAATGTGTALSCSGLPKFPKVDKQVVYTATGGNSSKPYSWTAKVGNGTVTATGTKLTVANGYSAGGIKTATVKNGTVSATCSVEVIGSPTPTPASTPTYHCNIRGVCVQNTIGVGTYTDSDCNDACSVP